MDKLKELVEQELKKIAETGLNSRTLDDIYKLVDIHKDLKNEEYWKKKEEGMEMRYNEGSYGRRRRDSRGRYMEGNYGHYMPDMYWDRMADGYEGYMEGRESYRRGNYNGKDQSIDSLERMLEGIVAFIEDIQQDPEQHEEREVVNKYIRKLREM